MKKLLFLSLVLISTVHAYVILNKSNAVDLGKGCFVQYTKRAVRQDGYIPQPQLRNNVWQAYDADGSLYQCKTREALLNYVSPDKTGQPQSKTTQPVTRQKSPQSPYARFETPGEWVREG